MRILFLSFFIVHILCDDYTKEEIEDYCAEIYNFRPGRFKPNYIYKVRIIEIYHPNATEIICPDGSIVKPKDIIRIEGYFRFYDVPVAWEDARRLCRLQKAVLAAAVNIQMQEMMLEFIQHLSVHGRIHTGFHSKFLIGDHIAIRGFRFQQTKHKWGEGEPIKTTKNHTTIAIDKFGKTYHVDLDAKYPFICFIKGKEDIKTNDCDTVDLDYIRVPRKDRTVEDEELHPGCYKFHYVRQPWKEAVATCFGESGSLAINPHKEVLQAFNHAVMFRLFNGRIGTNIRNEMHVGIYQNGTTGEWMTVFDKTLQKDKEGYRVHTGDLSSTNQWGEKPPSVVGKAIACGKLNVAGEYSLSSDLTCLERLPFICEMNTFQIV